MTKERLRELAEKYQARADRNYQNYQETGMSRYDREYRNAEEIADALNMAANAADEHHKLIVLRGDLYQLALAASRAQGDIEQMERFRRSLLATASVHGLFGEETHNESGRF